MKRKILAKIGLALTLCAGCATKPESSKKVSDSYANTSLTEVFDTMYSFKEYSADHDLCVSHFKTSEKLLQNYTQLFDIYNNYDGINNLKTINDNAGKQPVEVDQVIIDMLKMAKQFYDYSDGEFDITIGSFIVWHNYREEGIRKLNEEGKLGKLPGKEELEEASKHKGWG